MSFFFIIYFFIEFARVICDTNTILWIESNLTDTSLNLSGVMEYEFQMKFGLIFQGMNVRNVWRLNLTQFDLINNFKY